MSIHTKVTPELEAKLIAQKRKSTIMSVIIGITLMFLVGLIFWAVKVLIPGQKDTPAIVTYEQSMPDEEKPDKETVQIEEVQKKPTASASSLAKVLTTNAPADVAVAVPDVESDTLSTDFGAQEGFGSGGWLGSGSSGAGVGDSGVPDFGFIGASKTKAEKVCFVIDWSRSLVTEIGEDVEAPDRRYRLLKNELEKAMDALPDGTEVQVIFFSDLGRLATDTVSKANLELREQAGSGGGRQHLPCDHGRIHEGHRYGY